MHFRKFSLVIIFAAILASCTLPRTPDNPNDENSNAILTAAAETISASADAIPNIEKTATAALDDPTITPSVEIPEKTLTPLPSITNTAFPTNTPLPCNMATFVKDVSVPDNTVFGPGASFTKTWRLKNVGTCPWTSGYDLVFSSGDDMDGVESILLTNSTIAPGQSLDISIALKAPSAEGTYRGDWRLRDSGDTEFGLNTGSTFWVQIKVVAPTKAEISLNSIVSEAASVRSGGAVKEKIPNVGDTNGNEGSQAFISFDISAIPSDATITEVKVDFRSYNIVRDPFGGLNCLRMYAHNYLPIDNGDYTASGAVKSLVGWCNRSELDSISIENHLKDQLQTELGGTRLEFRLQFSDKHHDGDGIADMVRFSNDNVHFIKLLVSYTSP